MKKKRRHGPLPSCLCGKCRKCRWRITAKRRRDEARAPLATSDNVRLEPAYQVWQNLQEIAELGGPKGKVPLGLLMRLDTPVR